MSKSPTSPQTTLKLTAAQLGTLASSTRLAIIQRLDVDGEASAREIAGRLGRPVTALYHHLDQLEKSGLIRVVELRSTGRRPEAVYAAVSRQMSSADAVRTRSGRKNLIKVASSALAASLRAFAAVASQAATRFEGPQRNCAVRHLTFRADDARLARINGLISELEEAALHAGEGGENMLLTVLLAEVPGKRKG